MRSGNRLTSCQDDRAELVLYDEGCAICTAFAEAVQRRGLRVAPIGSPEGEQWLRDLSWRERYQAFHAIDACGRRRSGGAAVPLVASALPAGRVAARVARALPTLTELGYRAVARSRGRLSWVIRPTGGHAPHGSPSSPTSSPARGRDRRIPPPMG
jgi:predicted DCC family thiol-disulfide oxidoreductase YuxK